MSAWAQKEFVLVENAWPKMGAFRVYEGVYGGGGQFQPDRPPPLKIHLHIVLQSITKIEKQSAGAYRVPR